MPTQAFEVIGRGVFSLEEASRLTSIPRPRIRRWLVGYNFRSVSGERSSTPPLRRDYPIATGQRVALSFADLMEVRFLDHFVQAGVSWRTIRVAARKASEILKRDHPFSSRTFKTDGKTILLADAHDPSRIIDVEREIELPTRIGRQQVI